MLSGIGVLGMFTATIASFFVELQLRRDRGMKSFELSKHYIFCEWGARAKAVYQELRSDPRTADSPILLLTDSVDSVPVDDDDFHFIYGAPNEENLARAGVEEASTVVVFGDRRLDPVARDAKVVLTASDHRAHESPGLHHRRAGAGKRTPGIASAPTPTRSSSAISSAVG